MAAIAAGETHLARAVWIGVGRAAVHVADAELALSLER